MAIPGKHYDAPSYKDVKDIFERWKEDNDEVRKKIFTEFMNKSVNLNKVDESMIIAAVVAPPAAMVAKRTGQTTLPQLKFMNTIPDVVFVPSATVLALIAVKILRLMFIGNITTSKDATGSIVDNMIHPLALETTPNHSQKEIPKTSSDSDAKQDVIKATSDAHQLTPKRNYCALCKKVHDY